MIDPEEKVQRVIHFNGAISRREARNMQRWTQEQYGIHFPWWKRTWWRLLDLVGR